MEKEFSILNNFYIPERLQQSPQAQQRNRFHLFNFQTPQSPSHFYMISQLILQLLINSNVMENSGDLNKNLSNPSYSKNSKSQASSLLQITDPKKRYAEVIKQEKENERKKLHKKIEKQKEDDEKVYKKHLKAEINKRKKELQYLEREKESGMEEHKKATHQANIKKEKDRIRKMEDQVRAKTADQKTKQRYRQAKERQKKIDEEIHAKHTHAQNLRRTHLATEVVERQEAAKFNKSLNQRQSKEKIISAKETTDAINKYKMGLSFHGLSHKILNHTKPMAFVVKEEESDLDAFNKAQQQQLKNSEKEKLREEVRQKNRKTAEERGNQVLYKMQRQRQYEAYCKQAQQQQKRYNIRRLQAGKRNQFAGVKPLTLSQIDINKKLRSENQFERMFVDQAKRTSKGPVSKYTVVENKMVDVVVKPKPQEKWVKKPINYKDDESLIPAVSQGHYSFEQQNEEVSERSYNKSKKSEDKPAQKPKQPPQKIPQYAGKTHMKQTRLSNEAIRQELDYSDSEQDSNI